MYKANLLFAGTVDGWMYNNILPCPKRVYTHKRDKHVPKYLQYEAETENKGWIEYMKSFVISQSNYSLQ